MTSQAKIEANRLNAQRSTGPRSVPGKLSSSGNSRTHNLTAGGTGAEESHPGFGARLAEWEAEIRPQSIEARHALRRAVAATFRLERCESAYWAAIADHQSRARGAWDDDRLAEAADLLGRLSRRPEVVAPRLRTTMQGAAILLRLWDRLSASLDSEPGAWNDDEVATACDLLGIPVHLREGRLPFDPADPSADDVRGHRRAFVARESEALRASMEGGLASLDSLERSHAESGASAILARPIRLILRYESMAQRTFEKSLAAAKAPSSAEVYHASPAPRAFEPTFPSPTPVRDVATEAAIEKGRPTRFDPPPAWVAEMFARNGFGPSPEEVETTPTETRSATASPMSPGPNRRQRRRQEALARQG